MGGGAERVIVNIINSLDKNKFNIHLVLAQKQGIYFNNINNNINLIVFNYKKVIFSFFGLRKTIKSLSPDLIFSTTHRMNLMVALARLSLNEKSLLLLRVPNSPKLEIQNKQLPFFKLVIYKYAYRLADFVIAQTPEMADEVGTYFNVNKNKIKILINPIDKELIDKSIKNIDNPFNKTCVNVVAAGRLTRQKGFDVLIESFQYVINKNKNMRLHIIGQEASIEEKEMLQEIVNSLNLQKYINFLGFQENPYKYFYYSDLYVLSSRWEGLPNTVLENLYLKKPVVATRCIPFMDTLIENKEDPYFGCTLAEAKTLKIGMIKSQVSSNLYETWPSFKQVNAMAGIYGDTRKQDCITAIQASIDLSDTKELEINNATTIATVKAITV